MDKTKNLGLFRFHRIGKAPTPNGIIGYRPPQVAPRRKLSRRHFGRRIMLVRRSAVMAAMAVSTSSRQSIAPVAMLHALLRGLRPLPPQSDHSRIRYQAGWMGDNA